MYLAMKTKTIYIFNFQNYSQAVEPPLKYLKLSLKLVIPSLHTAFGYSFTIILTYILSLFFCWCTETHFWYVFFSAFNGKSSIYKKLLGLTLWTIKHSHFSKRCLQKYEIFMSEKPPSLAIFLTRISMNDLFLLLKKTRDKSLSTSHHKGKFEIHHILVT